MRSRSGFSLGARSAVLAPANNRAGAPVGTNHQDGPDRPEIMAVRVDQRPRNRDLSPLPLWRPMKRSMKRSTTRSMTQKRWPGTSDLGDGHAAPLGMAISLEAAGRRRLDVPRGG
jgi:hypothetical protein